MLIGTLMRFLVYIAIFLFSVQSAFPQGGKPQKVYEPEEAEEHFGHHNYLMAIPIYLQLLKQDPKNPEMNYKLGVCYMNTYVNKSAAIKYLETAVLENPKIDNEAYFLYGKALHLQNRFDEAINIYTKYKDLNAKHKDLVAKAELAIDQCNNGKLLIKLPVKVTFTNLGPEINTEFPDYYPWVTMDESHIFFTSRRKGGHTNTVETDGYYSSDIYTCDAVNGKWEKAKNLPGSGINTALDEEVVGIRPDGGELIIYIDHVKEMEDLYNTVKKGPGYSRLEKYNPNVNAGREFSGSITEDDQILFFVRDTKEGLGKQDIFMCKRLPNGQWALPQNLGENINTPYNEDFPYLSMDGRTLYFASEGHSSMGGFDLFKSVWDVENNTWSKPVNLGYPINTSDDERNISILPDNRAGYLCAWRKEGMGDLDIYRVKFEDEEQKYSFYKGKIKRSDSLSKAELFVTITAINKKTK
ncbi:MAG: PD40 domain-containing protein, partial [Bacteroidia bacterium]|nr:PD40 domain-containing protein [Bacteroidia bacterium]